jgi:hypothetical protein
MYQIEVRIKALLQTQVIEFTKTMSLPFPPVPWLFVREGGGQRDALRLCDVTWDTQSERFVCIADNDVDAAFFYGDDVVALIRNYEARGWKVKETGDRAQWFAEDESA